VRLSGNRGHGIQHNLGPSPAHENSPAAGSVRA
jgi:hypothetical protein